MLNIFFTDTMISCFQKFYQLFRLDIVKFFRITLKPKKIQNRNWKYLIESSISRVEEENSDFRLKTKKGLGLLKKIEKNYREARRVYDSIYQSAADNYLSYVNSFDLDKINDLNEDIRVNGSRMLNINKQTSARFLLETFDFLII